MTHETVRIVEDPASPTPSPGAAKLWRGRALVPWILLAVLIIALVLLSTGQLSRMMMPLFGRAAPPSSIAVAPAPQVTAPVPQIAAPAPAPMPRDNSAALDARLATLEKTLAEAGRTAVSRGELSDALIEARQSAQAAAQEAAQEAAQHAAEEAVKKAQTGQASAAALAALAERMAAMEKMAPAVVSIAEIDKRLAALERMAPAVVAIGDLERRLVAVERTAVAADAVAALDGRLQAVEKTAGPLAAMTQAAAQGESLALGLLNLRQALDSGAPYAEILTSLRLAAAADAALSAELDRLAAHAANGVPAKAMLRRRLLALPGADSIASAPTADRAAADEPQPEAGFWAEVGRRIGSTVKVRRLDGAAGARDGNFPSLAVERAVASLDADDLPGAIAALDSEAAPRDGAQQTRAAAVDDWLRDARARLAAETSFIALSRRGLSLLAARVGDAAPAAQRSPSPGRPAGSQLGQ